jgi:hypothetical protein
MSAIRVFYGQNAYESHLEQERQARFARLVAERKAALAMLKSVERLPRPRVLPSSEETCRRIADIVPLEDVRQQEAQSRRFAKSVRLVTGGAPGLGQR